MNKSGNLLNRSEIIFMVFGSIVGVGILSLPRDAAIIAHEDAWISVIIGAIYPIYMLILMLFFSKRFPSDDVITLSRKYFGKYIGNFYNIIFFTFFMFASAAEASGYNNVIRTFVEGFLSSYKILFILIFLCAYSSSKGIKVMGRTSVIVFFITIIMFLSPVSALKVSSFTNIMPIGGSGIKSIIAASKTTIFAYTGVEAIFIIYPFAEQKKSIRIDCFIGILISIIIYVWSTFISIYYLGADIAIKNYWPFLQVTESVTISFVNNFRYIFMFLWTLSAFKVVSNSYYLGVYILKKYLKKVDINIISYGVAPIVFLISLKFANVVVRGAMVSMVTLYYLAFNIIGLTILVLVILFKEGFRNRRKGKV